MKRTAFFLLTMFVVNLFSGFLVLPVRAQSTTSDSAALKAQEAEEAERAEEKRIEELTKTINELQGKINATKSEQQSLSSVLGVLNSQVLLNEKEIERTQSEINLLERQIVNLADRIEGLEVTLGQLSKMLLDRVQKQYKQSQADPVTLFFASTGISNFIKEQRYLVQAVSILKICS